MIQFRKQRIDELKIDHAPFVMASFRDDGDRYFVRDRHPHLHGLRTMYLPKPKRRKSAPADSLKHWGNKKWEVLHRWALTADVSDPYALLVWLCEWASDLPAGTCRCLHHWLEVISDDPPDFSSSMALFRWTVCVHNAVNRNLKHNTMTQADALLRWNSVE